MKKFVQPVLVVLSLVLVFGGLMFSNYQKNMAKIEAAHAKAAMVESRQQVKSDVERFGWRVPPSDPPIYGSPPELPPIPDHVYLPNGQPDLTMRLKYVVQNHPDPAVSEVMNRNIESGFLPITFDAGTGMVAKFSYMPNSMVAASTKPDARDWFPLFTFDANRLMHMHTKDEVLFAMAVTFHEFVHFQQWERADENVRRFFGPRKAGVITKEECAHVWTSEREAYELECHLVNSWGGVSELNGLCARVTSEEAFNVTLFSSMMNGPIGRGFPQCIEVWAQIGGAPHPEFYRL